MDELLTILGDVETGECDVTRDRKLIPYQCFQSYLYSSCRIRIMNESSLICKKECACQWPRKWLHSAPLVRLSNGMRTSFMAPLWTALKFACPEVGRLDSFRNYIEGTMGPNNGSFDPPPNYLTAMQVEYGPKDWHIRVMPSCYGNPVIYSCFAHMLW